MIVLHPFSPATASIRQHQTWVALELLRRHGRYPVLDWPCREEESYAEALALLWTEDDLCIVEHDLVPTLVDLVALDECPLPICTQAYQLRFEGAPVYAFRVREGETLRWGREGEEWADYFGLGCTRLKSAAMLHGDVADFRDARWRELDHRLSQLLAREGRVHVHWPAIRHVHH